MEDIVSEIEKSHNIIAIVKNDAVEDRIADAIIKKLDHTRRLRVLSRHIISLTTSDVLDIYEHEYEIDPTDVREILIAMNAVAMRGDNILVGLAAQGFSDLNEALLYLESVKGKVGNISGDSIRSSFPFSRPENFETYSFWFQATFFVRNRIHSPHDDIDLKKIEDIAISKGLALKDIYTDSDGS
jgi:hypothetical protein